MTNTATAGERAAANRAQFSKASPTGRLIIRYHSHDDASGTTASKRANDHTGRPQRSEWRLRKGLVLARKISDHHELVSVGEELSLVELKRQARFLSASDDVASASVEYRRYPLAQPNDPLYQGSTSPGDQSYFYEGDFSIRAPGAWDLTNGSSASVIAVVDTGILPDHPDIANRSIAGLGYDFVSADAPGIFTAANDGDGRDADPSDPGDACESGSSSWHGTGVASVAAANSNNGEGIAGVDWNARLLHARALGICGGTDADIIDAIRWSAGLPVAGVPINETPATVVNLSIGGATECTTAWQEVIDELNTLGIPFIIAAGNENSNALRSSPANCADVITVGSNTPAGHIDSGFSNYGLKVTIAAPGREILMATNTGVLQSDSGGNTYRRETGSSFSAALVTGAITLMQSVNSNLSPSEVRGILQDSATDFATDGACGLYYCGSGILNLSRAVAMTRDGTATGSGNSEQTIIDAQVTALPFTIATSGNLFGSRDIRYYRLDTTEPGMLTVNSNSTADLYGYLLNDRFSVLALDDDTGTGLNFRVAARVEPGTYYLAVERAIHYASDGETTFDLVADLSTDQPTPFSFNPVENAAINTPARSETIVINGLDAPAVISVSGGFYAINNGEVTASQGTVSNGDSIYVTLQSAPAIETESSLLLTVGAFSTGFSVTTGTDTTPTPGPSTDTSSGSGCSLRVTDGHHTAAARLDPTFLLLLVVSAVYLARAQRVRRAF